MIIRLRHHLIILITVLLYAAMGTQDLRSEHVFLKDGSIVSGSIVVDAAKSITVKNKEGKLQTVGRDKIMRILYTELYMGKVFIRMNDGTVKNGYLVDEDQTTYTFRKELFKVDEFTVLREKVLFLARTNPTDLAGTPGADEISLKWSPPFQPAKTYRVYLKSQEKDFTVAHETDETDCVLEGLKSNRKYSIKVTAVDNEGIESLPSNQIEVTTKNFPPQRPTGLSLVKLPSGDKTTLHWKASIDPDGTVKEYRLYRKTEKELQKIAMTKDLHYDLPAGSDPYIFTVKAVDDRGDESTDSGYLRKGWINLRASYSLLFPMENMKDLFSVGNSVTVGVFVTDVLFANSVFGADIGYVYWSGGPLVMDCMHMFPVTLWGGYRFQLMENLWIIPSLHFGGAYMHTRYKGRGETGVELLSVTMRDGVDMLLGAGIDLHATRADGAFFQAGIVYTMLIETPMPFMYAGLRVAGGIQW